MHIIVIHKKKEIFPWKTMGQRYSLVECRISENVAQGYAIVCQLCVRLLIVLTTGTVALGKGSSEQGTRPLSFIHRATNITGREFKLVY